MDVNLAAMEVDQPPVKGVGLAAAAALCTEGDNTPSDWHLGSLLRQLTACLDSRPTEKPPERYGTVREVCISNVSDSPDCLLSLPRRG